jgi:hypothetical protein
MLKDPSKACRVMAISCLGRRVRNGIKWVCSEIGYITNTDFFTIFIGKILGKF